MRLPHPLNARSPPSRSPSTINRWPSSVTAFAHSLRGSAKRAATPQPPIFDVDTDATPEQIATLLKLTERYCVILQTLRSAPPRSVAHAVVAS
jgi:hypothetical protein